jgi:predicted TIM-barrel fold metal-dependent hydrolase
VSESSIVVCPVPPPATKPKNVAPEGATDAHFHIFGPPDKYPTSARRMYDPPLSTVDSYLNIAETLGIQRMVVVQASIYGADNSCLLDSIAEFGLHRARGIAVVEQGITFAELNEMHERGVRGIRFNAITGHTPLEWLPELAKLIEPLGWHIQLWIKGSRLLEIADLVRDLPVPVSLDHMGQVPVELGLDHPQFQNVLRLLDSGRCWIKLTGYRASSDKPPYPDLEAPVRAMLRAAPERCLWGTDWPHVYLEHRPMPDAGLLFDLLHSWATSDEAHRILVDNPERLYGFPT